MMVIVANVDDVDCYARRLVMSLKSLGRDVVKLSVIRW